MRHYSRELNNELFRYRKRKRLSLDGTVAGLGSARFPRKVHPAGMPGPRGPAVATQHQSIYDARGFYEWREQDYQQPEAWFDRPMMSRTPQLRLNPPTHDHGSHEADYRGSLLTEEMMAQAMERAAQARPEDQSAAFNALSRAASSSPEDAPAAMEAQGGPQAMEPAQAEMIQQLDGLQGQEAAMTAGENMAPDPVEACEQQFQQNLEAMVQDPLPEQDPLERQQQMYEQQMQMMDPFMMAGGFGPFGPGPMPGM